MKVNEGEMRFASDPFNPAHPGLNHRPVRVRALLSEEWERPFDERRIDWSRLGWEDRLTLERLLAAACVKV